MREQSVRLERREVNARSIPSTFKLNYRLGCLVAASACECHFRAPFIQRQVPLERVRRKISFSSDFSIIPGRERKGERREGERCGAGDRCQMPVNIGKFERDGRRCPKAHSGATSRWR